MEHYVTIFNGNFLPQGLALHASMERHIVNYNLWILCVDDYAYSALKMMSLKNVNLLNLTDLENDELLIAKNNRSTKEYCWTLTPFASGFVFSANPAVKRVTYLDADLWFRKSPAKIFDEFFTSKKQVLITDHGYAPEYDQSELFGQYCVQFIIFERSSLEVLKSWEMQCLNWCYEVPQNGKFGDQKYLDDWPEKFGSMVHILQNKELALAPWNATRFPFANAVFYHFHGLRIMPGKKIQLGAYPLPKNLFNHVYIPYIDDLKSALKNLNHAGVAVSPQVQKVGLINRLVSKIKVFHKRPNMLREWTSVKL